MPIRTDSILDSVDLGEKERDRQKKRKQVKNNKAEDNNQGKTPTKHITKHTRTGGKCKVETTPKESNKGMSPIKSIPEQPNNNITHNLTKSQPNGSPHHIKKELFPSFWHYCHGPRT
jgi:hypothetical protein